MIKRMRRIKDVDGRHPVTFLCADISQAAEYAQIDHRAHRLIKRLTPGPYTFILPSTKLVPKVLESKRKTLGIRIPDHPVPLALVQHLGRALFNTTATTPDGTLLSDPREIRDALGHGVDLIFDAGLNLFDSSTVVDLCGEVPEVLREGKGPIDQL